MTRTLVLERPCVPAPVAPNSLYLRWSWAGGWHPAGPNPPPAQPAAVTVEARGLRGHRRSDDAIALLRPYAHAGHFAALCVRAGVPPVPVDVFVDSARLLARRLGGDVPSPPHSLHLVARAAAGDGPRGAARFTLTASVEANRAGLRPVRARVDGRCAGTGPGSPHPFFVTGPAARACLLTPAIDSGPVIARDTVLRLARVLGFESREEARDVREWHEDALSGRVTEAFVCTDAALVMPVYAVHGPHGAWRIGDGQPGAAAIALRRAMIRLVRGAMRDDERWLDVLR